MKKNHDTLVGNILLVLIVVAMLVLLILFFTEAEWGEKKEVATVPPVVEKSVVQVQNEPEAEASGEAGGLENVNSCSGDNNSCWAADDLDDVRNLQEEKNVIHN